MTRTGPGSESMFYSRRKMIIDEINVLKRKRGSTAAAAVEELELVRERSNMTLNSLAKILKKQRTDKPS